MNAFFFKTEEVNGKEDEQKKKEEQRTERQKKKKKKKKTNKKKPWRGGKSLFAFFYHTIFLVFVVLTVDAPEGGTSMRTATVTTFWGDFCRRILYGTVDWIARDANRLS